MLILEDKTISRKCLEHTILIQSTIVNKEYTTRGEEPKESTVIYGYCIKCGLYIKRNTENNKTQYFDLSNEQIDELEENLDECKYIEPNFNPSETVKTRTKNTTQTGYLLEDEDYINYYERHKDRKFYWTKMKR